MSKYAYLSRYYFDDKDIFDLLSSPKFGQRALLQLTRERGLLLSNEEDRETLIQTISQNPFDWPEVLRIFERISAEDPDERRTSERLENCGDSLEKVNEALEKTRDLRNKKHGEIYVITKRGEGNYEVKVTYIDFDASMTRGMQRRERDLTIELEKNDTRLDIRYNQNERAKAIVDEISKQLNLFSKTGLARTAISLAGIRDPAKRTQFFLGLMQKMKGFRLLDVKDLKVDNRFPEVIEESQLEDDSEESEDSEAESAESAEIKSLVKKVALSGQSLLTSDLYQKLKETGYFISQVAWLSKEDIGAGRVAQFVAEFIDPVEATGFTFDVKRVLPRDGTEDKQKTATELLASERRRMRQIVETAAYESYAELTNPKKTPDVKSKKSNL